MIKACSTWGFLVHLQLKSRSPHVPVVHGPPLKALATSSTSLAGEPSPPFPRARAPAPRSSALLEGPRILAAFGLRATEAAPRIHVFSKTKSKERKKPQGPRSPALLLSNPNLGRAPPLHARGQKSKKKKEGPGLLVVVPRTADRAPWPSLTEPRASWAWQRGWGWGGGRPCAR